MGGPHNAANYTISRLQAEMHSIWHMYSMRYSCILDFKRRKSFARCVKSYGNLSQPLIIRSAHLQLEPGIPNVRVIL